MGLFDVFLEKLGYVSTNRAEQYDNEVILKLYGDASKKGRAVIETMRAKCLSFNIHNGIPTLVHRKGELVFPRSQFIGAVLFSSLGEPLKAFGSLDRFSTVKEHIPFFLSLSKDNPSPLFSLHSLGNIKEVRSEGERKLSCMEGKVLVYGDTGCGKSLLATELLFGLNEKEVSTNKPFIAFGHKGDYSATREINESVVELPFCEFISLMNDGVFSSDKINNNYSQVLIVLDENSEPEDYSLFEEKIPNFLSLGYKIVFDEVHPVLNTSAGRELQEAYFSMLSRVQVADYNYRGTLIFTTQSLDADAGHLSLENFDFAFFMRSHSLGGHKRDFALTLGVGDYCLYEKNLLSIHSYQKQDNGYYPNMIEYDIIAPVSKLFRYSEALTKDKLSIM